MALLALGLLAGLIVEGNGFDGSILRSVAADRTAGATAAARSLTDLGAQWLDIVFAAALALLLALRRRRDAIFLLLAAGGAMALTNAIKFILMRPRPHGGLVSVASYSWPSGHAASSIGFYGALALLATRAVPASTRVAIWIGLALLTGLIGATRVYLGVHYPTDVVAGWTVGGLWLVGVTRIVAVRTSPDPAPAPRRDSDAAPDRSRAGG